MRGNIPLAFRVDGEDALDDGGPLQAADGEGVGARLLHRHDLAVAHCELIERLAVVVALRLRLEAHQVAVVEQDEVAVAPVADVLAALLQPALLHDGAGRARLRHAGLGLLAGRDPLPQPLHSTSARFALTLLVRCVSDGEHEHVSPVQD